MWKFENALILGAFFVFALMLGGRLVFLGNNNVLAVCRHDGIQKCEKQQTDDHSYENI